MQVFIFYVFKEINFKQFLISGLALLHCHADFHMVLLKIKYQQGRHGNKRQSAVLDISRHLNVGKACEGRCTACEELGSQVLSLVSQAESEGM